MKKGKQLLNYREGDVFAVPLRDGGFGRGVVARTDGRGSAFGYFFGPRVPNFEGVKVDQSLDPENAILVGLFGDLGLLNGEWKVLGRIEPWRRSDWPLPPLGRLVEGDELGYLSFYDEDTLTLVKEERHPPEEIAEYPYNRLMGYGACEIRLTKLLQRTGQ